MVARLFVTRIFFSSCLRTARISLLGLPSDPTSPVTEVTRIHLERHNKAHVSHLITREGDSVVEEQVDILRHRIRRQGSEVRTVSYRQFKS